MPVEWAKSVSNQHALRNTMGSRLRLDLFPSRTMGSQLYKLIGYQGTECGFKWSHFDSVVLIQSDGQGALSSLCTYIHMIHTYIHMCLCIAIGKRFLP